MRGEHGTLARFFDCSPGSSPHARGAQESTIHKFVNVGIIPACAGSTAVHSWRGRMKPDHPRMRGEHRGIINVRLPATRIIPACAGSTTSYPTPQEKPPDHPRMRGEHERTSGAGYQHDGSSPHARGALFFVVVAVLAVGIIPACAGSTQTQSAPTSATKDHPRMRGEHPPSR